MPCEALRRLVCAGAGRWLCFWALHSVVVSLVAFKRMTSRPSGVVFPRRGPPFSARRPNAQVSAARGRRRFVRGHGPTRARTSERRGKARHGEKTLHYLPLVSSHRPRAPPTAN